MRDPGNEVAGVLLSSRLVLHQFVPSLRSIRSRIDLCSEVKELVTLCTMNRDLLILSEQSINY